MSSWHRLWVFSLGSQRHLIQLSTWSSLINFLSRVFILLPVTPVHLLYVVVQHEHPSALTLAPFCIILCAYLISTLSSFFFSFPEHLKLSKTPQDSGIYPVYPVMSPLPHPMHNWNVHSTKQRFPTLLFTISSTYNSSWHITYTQ